MVGFLFPFTNTSDEATDHVLDFLKKQREYHSRMSQGL